MFHIWQREDNKYCLKTLQENKTKIMLYILHLLERVPMLERAPPGTSPPPLTTQN